jgi:type I restriction enzyme, R subunit
VLATASINNAIEYYKLLKKFRSKETSGKSRLSPLNIACVFSPPAEGNKDIQQIQEDLTQEKEDNKQNPEEKKST